MFAFSRCLRFSKFAFSLYIIVAVLYTTHQLLVAPIRAGFLALLGFLSPHAWFSFPFDLFPSPWNSDSADNHSTTGLQRSGGASGDTIYWNSSILVSGDILGTPELFPMDQKLFLSKAFSNSMQPSRIIPFYYRATKNFAQEEITITTLITSNRFSVFTRLVERYKGKAHIV